MRTFFTLCFAISISYYSNAQKNTGSAYPSLLWEITGNGLTQPSYLFGTMHVSNKMVFHLSDSFYNAIASCSTVSLELDPRQWQSEMFRLQQSQVAMSMYMRPVNDLIRERSFRTGNGYEDNIKRALSEEPYVVNGLLYRTMEGQSNFQENTYLDLYVYQTACRLGKKATGVENYQETQRIQLEANEDMLKDRNRNRINFNNENPYELQKKIQDAYRRGDLGMLDSLSQVTGGSEAFNEKFLYGRNGIQANSIDSIIRKESLFVAVGAAHLPGKRGVIEMLRNKGYTLRPVSMTDRDAEQRDRVDKIRVPIAMQSLHSDDGFIEMQVPGSMFRRTELALNESWQYADMENGSYYMLSRIRTHPGLFAENETTVARKTDSLLYENIPGKILQKKNISINGYKGVDIINKTRRGDIQRYNIIFTPQEVLVFKMSGNDNYVYGPESDLFFGSIHLKETAKLPWRNYAPASGGFSVNFPNEPGVTSGKGDDMLNSNQFEAIDTETGDAYMVWQKSIHNYNFIEEDTLDLHLVEESLKGSEIIEKEISRKFARLNGYNSLDMLFNLKDGGVLKARALIKGAQYYLLTARSKDKKNSFARFFNSFRIEEFRYPKARLYTDSAIGFSVMTPVQPAIDSDLREFLNRQQFGTMAIYFNDRYQRMPPRNACFKNDSTGEAILVTAITFPKYYSQKDTAQFWEAELNLNRLSSDLVVQKKLFTARPDSSLVFTYVLADTNTNRKIRSMAVLRNNVLYRVNTLIDDLSPESSFVSDFFTTFQPVNTSKNNVFLSKTGQFISDLQSSDSSLQKLARSAVTQVNWVSADFPALKNIFNSLKPDSREYLLTKTKCIQAIGVIKDTSGIGKRIEWLKNIYTNYSDTNTFQNAALLALANTKTRASYFVMRDLLTQNPAIFENAFEYQGAFQKMGDSLSLASVLYPELLQLTQFDDYKQPVLNLLIKLSDSGYIQPELYASQFTKLFFDAQIQAKKLQSLNQSEIIRTQADQERNAPDMIYNNPVQGTAANNLLAGYLTLLVPYYDQNTQVSRFFGRLLQSNDPQTKMAAALVLLKKDKPVPDSVLEFIAASDLNRAAFYDKLEKIKKAGVFPRRYLNQEAMSKSVLINSRANLRIAEVQPMGRKWVETKKAKGYAYFFKYRVQKQGDWLIGISGVQPGDTLQVNTDRTLVNMNNKKLLTNGTEREQFEKMIDQLVLSKRKSAMAFYTPYGNMFEGL